MIPETGLDKEFLRRSLWTTGWASAGVSLIAWQLGGFDWAGRYAAVALFAWINWVLLARLLLAIVRRQFLPLMLAIGGKVLNFGWFVGWYLPLAGAEPTSLLAGINTFFAVVAWSLIGRHFHRPVSFHFSQSPAAAHPRETRHRRLH